MKHLSRRYILFLIFLLLKNIPVKTQPLTFNSAEIYGQIKGLSTFCNVLYIGVTPADKNIPLLSYFSTVKNYRTGFLSITRGENLPNKYGSENGLELGLVHVAEGMEASHINDVENYYSNAYDVGSLMSEEQLALNWDTSKILSDVVWVIRNFRPDIIIMAYNPTNDRVSAEQKTSAFIVTKAFALAGDSLAFPDQLKYGAECWQAKRLLYDKPDTTNLNHHSAIVNTNIFNATSGETTIDITNTIKHLEKSIYDDSSYFNYMDTLEYLSGDSSFTGVTDGIDTSWHRINSTTFKIIQLLSDSIISNYNFLEPSLSTAGLIQLYKMLAVLNNDNYWVKRKLADIQRLIFLCSGISIQASSDQAFAVPGDSLNVNISVYKRSPVYAELNNVTFPDYSDTILNLHLAQLQPFSIKKTIAVTKDKHATQPYWLINPQSLPYMYDVEDQYVVGNETNEPEYKVYILITIDSLELSDLIPVQYVQTNKYIDNLPVQNVVTALPILVYLTPNNILTNVKPGNDFTKNQQLKIQFTSNISADSVPVKIKVAQLGMNVMLNGKTINKIKRNNAFEIDSVMNLTKNESYSINVPLKNSGLINSDTSAILGVTISTQINGDTTVYSSALRTISYNYLPTMNYYYRDLTKVIADEIKTNGGKVGYLFSANDDLVPYALQQLGYNVKLLGAEDCIIDSLKNYKAIIFGINANDIEAALDNKYDTLLNYVSNGGNLVFLDNKNSIELKKPFSISSAPIKIPFYETQVSFTNPVGEVFNYPNKITEQDFKQWKKNYTDFTFLNTDEIFQTSVSFSYDNNKSITQNSLLIKQYGKGNLIFSGISLPAQIAGGVTSAYKLLANIVDLPSNKDQ